VCVAPSGSPSSRAARSPSLCRRRSLQGVGSGAEVHVDGKGAVEAATDAVRFHELAGHVGHRNLRQHLAVAAPLLTGEPREELGRLAGQLQHGVGLTERGVRLRRDLQERDAGRRVLLPRDLQQFEHAVRRLRAIHLLVDLQECRR